MHTPFTQNPRRAHSYVRLPIFNKPAPRIRNNVLSNPLDPVYFFNGEHHGAIHGARPKRGVAHSTRPRQQHSLDTSDIVGAKPREIRLTKAERAGISKKTTAEKAISLRTK